MATHVRAKEGRASKRAPTCAWRPPLMRATAKSVLAALCATVALYTVHRQLQQQYYRQCKADLIRVVLYEQSAVCTHMARILQLVELAYHQVVKQVTSSVLDALSGAGGAGAWVAAGGAGLGA